MVVAAVLPFAEFAVSAGWCQENATTAQKLEPTEIFLVASKSVVIVEGLGPDGRVLAQGSGVVLDPKDLPRRPEIEIRDHAVVSAIAERLPFRHVVTNWHVVEGAEKVRVRQESELAKYVTVLLQRK